MRLVDEYDPDLPLDHAWTIPASWYVNQDLYNLELRSVFSNTWQLAARTEQVMRPGQYVTTDVAGEPIVVVATHRRSVRGRFTRLIAPTDKCAILR